MSIVAGNLLVSEPFMDDMNFKRTVLMVCEHNEKGSFGLVLNKEMAYKLGDAVPDLTDFKASLYYGGPVEQDTLHFLHSCPELFEDSVKLTDEIYWGGDFERLKMLLNTKQIEPSQIRFFIGYSGWGEGQLDLELKHKTWIVSNGASHNFLDQDSYGLLASVLENMGGKFKVISMMPEDPSLN